MNESFSTKHIVKFIKWEYETLVVVVKKKSSASQDQVSYPGVLLPPSGFQAAPTRLRLLSCCG